MSAYDAPATEAAPPPGGIPQRPLVPSWRLVLTLALAGATAAFALSFVHGATKDGIARNRAAVVAKAVESVLPGVDPASVVSFHVGTRDGKRVLVQDESVEYIERRGVTRVYLGRRPDGSPIGFALVGERYGYGSDPIKLAFGYDAARNEILGIKVIIQKETPAIGDKIEQSPFVDQFQSPPGEGAPRKAPRKTPLVPTRPRMGNLEDEYEVDTISGSTISSNAVIEIINEVLHGPDGVGALIEAWKPGEGQ